MKTRQINGVFILALSICFIPFVWFPNTKEAKIAHAGIIAIAFLGSRLAVNTIQNPEEY